MSASPMELPLAPSCATDRQKTHKICQNDVKFKLGKQLVMHDPYPPNERFQVNRSALSNKQLYQGEYRLRQGPHRQREGKSAI